MFIIVEMKQVEEEVETYWLKPLSPLSAAAVFFLYLVLKDKLLFDSGCLLKIRS